jgi:hypothetical protein
MADWKQITARIRRARTGKDPAGQLTNLFSKTRDAMVAFELARYFESSGNTADAGRWYLTAAERFREPELAGASSADVGETYARPEPAASSLAEPNRQRRGRRGGRDARPVRRAPQHSSARAMDSPSVFTSRAVPDEPPARAAEIEPVETTPEAVPPPSLRGRYGDPGLASRLTQLEMNFRRLLACAPVTLDAADKAPAGPGVWVLTDSDLTTYYYVQACQTLRVAIPNLLRSGAGRRGESIRPGLAEHLGIPESRVSKYLEDHCVVRWLQMDDDASYFAHFLIAVLHPALNE